MGVLRLGQICAVSPDIPVRRFCVSVIVIKEKYYLV